MQVAVITVGDELLVGEITDTNATWLCQRLAEQGASVGRVVTVPDDVDDIAATVADLHDGFDAVVVTGGLGPTHDDVTMAGVAAAVGRDLEPHAAAREWLTGVGGYVAGDLVDGTTHLPAGARMLPNEEGVAPGAVIEGIYVLPGVPGEMKAMFESVAGEFDGETTYTTVVDVDEPESELIDRFVDLQERFDVGVGSYPGESVRVKLTAGDETALAEARRWLEERVDLVDGESRE